MIVKSMYLFVEAAQNLIFKIYFKFTFFVQSLILVFYINNIAIGLIIYCNYYNTCFKHYLLVISYYYFYY